MSSAVVDHLNETGLSLAKQQEVERIKSVSKKLDPKTFAIHFFVREALTISVPGIKLVKVLSEDTCETIATIIYHPCGEPTLFTSDCMSLTLETIWSWIIPLMTHFDYYLMIAEAKTRGYIGEVDDEVSQNIEWSGGRG